MGEGFEQRMPMILPQEEAFSSSEHRSSCSASMDFTEDATSLSTDSSRLTQQLERNGPLYDLSSLMTQLPVKRGLSKFYQGKSQSFTSLSNVLCLEDLVKKDCHFRRMKPRRVGAGAVKQASYVPGPFGRIISKKFSRGSCSSLVSRKSSSNSSNLPCT